MKPSSPPTGIFATGRISRNAESRIVVIDSLRLHLVRFKNKNCLYWAVLFTDPADSELDSHAATSLAFRFRPFLPVQWARVQADRGWPSREYHPGPASKVMPPSLSQAFPDPCNRDPSSRSRESPIRERRAGRESRSDTAMQSESRCLWHGHVGGCDQVVSFSVCLSNPSQAIRIPAPGWISLRSSSQRTPHEVE